MYLSLCQLRRRQVRETSEEIPLAPNSLDDHRLIGIALQLTAKLHHNAVETAIIGLPASVEHTLTQLFSGLGITFVGNKLDQQIAFGGR